ncbi:MAG TPA: hypothetical protein VNX88_03580 [Terriglobales bacterium]|jgi:hypothetical protein|nr:hypothetical protein [Terriglobales bacterium]
MKYLALLFLACAVSVAQDRTASTCPVLVSVAGTDVPMETGKHIVLWFTNQSSKIVSGTQFKLSAVDSSGLRYSVSDIYYAAWETMPGAGGLVVKSAKDEEKYFGSTWRNMRGVEVQVSRVFFSDGTQWQPSGNSCSRVFMNADFVHDMRRWNTQIRAEWNRTHPSDRVPAGSLAAWLDPKNDGWR